MKIIFMGSPDFAVNSAQALYDAGHEIILVVTQPDRPKGRSGEPTPGPVKQWALDHGIATFQPEKIKDEESVEYMRQFEGVADVAVVVAFGQILPKSILDMPRLGCVNVHASLLPKYRGAAPIQWSIINGDEYTGITTMQMGIGLDDGDILMQREYKIAADETGGGLFDKLAVIGGELIVDTLDKLDKGEIYPIQQNHSEATKVGMIKKYQGQINWTKTATEIERLVRGLNPWPSAFTYTDGKQLKIWNSVVTERPAEWTDKRGMVLADVSTGLLPQPGQSIGDVVCCGDDTYLKLIEVQLEGKKRMPAADFLRGAKLNITNQE